VDLIEARAAAVSAVIAAEEVIAEHLQTGDWQVHTKPDDTPVTEVDIAAERAIRRVLAEALPDAAFFGEETGRVDSLQDDGDQAGDDPKHKASSATNHTSPYLWLVDPIDGTKSFIRGMPFYSTQIALQVNGDLVLGVSNAPAYGERLVAAKGMGVTLNQQPVEIRDVARLEDAYLSCGNLTSLAGDVGRWQALATIITRVKRTRGYGDFCHYHQLCCGQTDLIIESDLNILDIAALSVGVREAGGVITDLQGGAIDLQSTSVLAAGTQQLHQAALAALNA